MMWYNGAPLVQLSGGEPARLALQSPNQCGDRDVTCKNENKRIYMLWRVISFNVTRFNGGRWISNSVYMFRTLQ